MAPTKAVAFSAGAFLGTVAVDIARAFITSDATAYGTVFVLEGGLFLISALIALTTPMARAASAATLIPGE